MERTISPKKALLTIFLSLFFVSGPVWLTLVYHQSLKARRLKDNTFIIKELRTFTALRDQLPDDYFAETLQLSCDKPTNIAAFNREEAETKLLKSPIIEWAKVQLEGSTLLIEYALRTPIFRLLDYENTLMDGKGEIFPYEPYFTKKRLPELYLGLNGEKRDLAFHVLSVLSRELIGMGTRLIRIDLGRAFARSLGQREIVVILEERERNKVYLRLDTETFEEGLKRYKKLNQKSSYIDLRLKNMAFIQG